MNRHTKIICTIGPKSSSREMIDKLIAAGMDVARLNFSHGTHDTHRHVYETLRERAAAWGKNITILQDLQGPKIRLGILSDDKRKEIHGGETLYLTLQADARPNAYVSDYEHLTQDVRPGDPILLDDGNIVLQAAEVTPHEVVCHVLQGGMLRSRVGMNLPKSYVSAPALSEKDLEDARFGLSLGVDYIALSFVRTAGDIEKLRAEIGACEPHIIAKIERPEAVQNLQEIIDAADGIMVARGDLGVELEPQKVPLIQKRAIELANLSAKPVIVATQMLESMIEHVRPTRAEASDVANAVFDGADAVMLSGETANGAHPIRTVEMMAAIISEVESSERYWESQTAGRKDAPSQANAVARATVAAQSELGLNTIAVHTMTGYSARLISSHRPRAAIIALSSSVNALRRMNLYWGVTSEAINEVNGTDELLKAIDQIVLHKKHVTLDELIAVCANAPVIRTKSTNFLKLHRVGE